MNSNEVILQNFVSSLDKEIIDHNGWFIFRIHKMNKGGVNTTLGFIVSLDGEYFSNTIVGNTQDIIASPDKYKEKLIRLAKRVIKTKKYSYKMVDDE